MVTRAERATLAGYYDLCSHTDLFFIIDLLADHLMTVFVCLNRPLTEN